MLLFKFLWRDIFLGINENKKQSTCYGSFIKYRKVVNRVATSDNDWQRMTMSDNEWQRVVQRVTTNDKEWHRVTRNNNEWYNEWQRMTMSDNEWQRLVQRVTTNDSEWQRVTTNDKEWQRVTRNDSQWYNEWQWIQRVTVSANFSFFQIREEPTTNHPKENSLNLEEDLWKRPIELRAETSTQEEISSVRSRNCRSGYSQIFIKISVLKNFAIFTGKRLYWSPLLRKFQVLKPASLLKGDSNQ